LIINLGFFNTDHIGIPNYALSITMIFGATVAGWFLATIFASHLLYNFCVVVSIS
jgi:hypothetical protein